ncbi:MAG: PKD domain-containing protein [Bacteroidota bacterium]
MKFNFLTVITIFFGMCISSCLPLCKVYAQVTFQKVYGGSSGDAANCIVQSSDSGYVMTGYTVGFGAGSQDVYLFKTNKLGKPEWFKTYGGVNEDVGKSLQQTTDGGFIIGGYTGSFGSGFNDVYLIKTDSLGNLNWSKIFGGFSTDKGYSVLQANDSGYIILGNTFSFGAGSSDIYLTKTDSIGNLEWSITYGGDSYDEAYSIQPTNDGGYIIIGTTVSFGAGSEDIYVLKINWKGEIQWSKTYGGDAWDRGMSILQTNDGGYIISAFTQSFDTQKHYDLRCYLLKTDSAGNAEWSKVYGVLDSENVPYSIIQTMDGGYCIAGYTEGNVGSLDYHAYLNKFDEYGNLQWSKTMGNGYINACHSLLQTSDEGFIIAGITNGFGSGGIDIYLIKTTSDGNSGCYYSDANTLIGDTLPLITNPNDEVHIYSFSSNDSTIVHDTSLIQTILCISTCDAKSSFTASDSIICVGNTLYLYSTSTGAISVEWQVNGVAFDTSKNTSIIIDSLGVFTISLISDNDICKDTAYKEITVTDTIITDFSFSVYNLTVTFIDSSVFAETWYWDFGDGNTETLRNPAHTYPDTGKYNVCLTVTNDCRSDTLCREVYISCKFPVAGFYFIDSGLTVSFFDSSFAYDSIIYWFWDFGDEEDTTLQNPIHVYDQAGTYLVCHAVSSDCGPDDFCMEITISDTGDGIQKFELNSSVIIYPNPTQNDLTITTNFITNKDVEIKIYNLLGELIYKIPEQSVNSENFVINLSGLPPGVYNLIVYTDNNISNRRFVIIK